MDSNATIAKILPTTILATFRVAILTFHCKTATKMQNTCKQLISIPKRYLRRTNAYFY